MKLLGKNLKTKNPKITSFYLLPKTHRPHNPGRPIVKSIGSVTEKISAFADEHLRKFTPRIPSYVKDTTHFINITKNIQFDLDDLLVTIEVSSLYTNIPHTQGISAIHKMMEETGTDTLHKVFISNLTPIKFSPKTTFSLMINYLNENRKLQWEPEWHQIMLLYLCTTWKLISLQATQSNQKFG